MKIYYTIYKTTNLITNNYYIGMHKTKNIYDDYLGSGLLIKRAIKKYGKEYFKKDILFIFDNKEEMKQKEKEIVIIDLVNNPDCYNIKLGGEGGFDHISKEITKEARTKLWKTTFHREKMKPIQSNNMKTTLKKLWTDPEYKIKMQKVGSKNLTKLWKDHREKMISLVSNNMTLLQNNPEFKKILINANKKLWENENYRKKKSKCVSENNKRLWEQQEYREKMSIKISESHKGRNYIHNDTLKSNKIIYPIDLQSYLDNGWEIGRRIYV